jgi:hypothetical protein
MYRNKKAMAAAGKTMPTSGTKIVGKKEAAINYIVLSLNTASKACQSAVAPTNLKISLLRNGQKCGVA